MAEKKKTAEKVNDSPEMETVKGQTRSGLIFEINPKVKDDTRTLRYLQKLQDKTLTEKEQIDAVFNLLELIFGKEGVDIFLNEVAARHDGVADAASLLEELTDIFEAAKLKN